MELEKEHDVRADVSIAWVRGVLWGLCLSLWQGRGGRSPPSCVVSLMSPSRWPSWWELMLPTVRDTDVHLAPCCLAGGHGLCL